MQALTSPWRWPVQQPDYRDLLTEVFKYLIVGLIGFVVAKVNRWFEGHHKTSRAVEELKTSVTELVKSISGMEHTVDKRMAELEGMVELRLTSMDRRFTGWQRESQHTANEHESRLIRMEERFRAYLLLKEGPRRIAQVEAMLPVNMEAGEEGSCIEDTGDKPC